MFASKVLGPETNDLRRAICSNEPEPAKLAVAKANQGTAIGMHQFSCNIVATKIFFRIPPRILMRTLLRYAEPEKSHPERLFLLPPPWNRL
jgi:hypothetical protein